MPSMDIQVLEGVFDGEEKAAIIERVTAAFATVSGQTIAHGLSIRIHEVKSAAWGYAGTVLKTQDALAMKAKG
ncbi:tautomerase family protein [Thalassococcus sp. BH17M4-6]|uniref:tautomerase family protein n=1 Tax=Thalassococcus sp. BH17M4-6 TaxID=3413148 RepID=UPI003BE991E4